MFTLLKYYSFSHSLSFLYISISYFTFLSFLLYLLLFLLLFLTSFYVNSFSFKNLLYFTLLFSLLLTNVSGVTWRLTLHWEDFLELDHWTQCPTHHPGEGGTLVRLRGRRGRDGEGVLSLVDSALWFKDDWTDFPGGSGSWRSLELWGWPSSLEVGLPSGIGIMVGGSSSRGRREAEGWRRRLPFWIQVEWGGVRTGVPHLLWSFLMKVSTPWFVHRREGNSTSSCRV